MPEDQENPSLEDDVVCGSPTWDGTVGMISAYPLQCTSIWPAQRYANLISAPSRRILENLPLLPVEPPPLSINPMAVSQAVAVIESALKPDRSSTFYTSISRKFVNRLQQRFSNTHLAMFLTDVWNWIEGTAISLITKPKE